MATAKVAIRKVFKEKLWSISVVGLLIIGLTTWIIVPSISASLQTGLSDYNNKVGTYLFVYNTGLQDQYSSRIPPQIEERIWAISGVQEVYPVVLNWTYFLSTVYAGAFEGDESAVIGGQGGFPLDLIAIADGRLPGDGAEFITNGHAISRFPINQIQTAFFQIPENVSVAGDVYRNERENRQYVRFNATALGQMPYNSMLQQAQVLWNSTFVRAKLGEQLYAHTFGGEGANYFIVKAQDIAQVEQIASNLQTIFADYPGYSIIYDKDIEQKTPKLTLTVSPSTVFTPTPKTITPSMTTSTEHSSPSGTPADATQNSYSLLYVVIVAGIIISITSLALIFNKRKNRHQTPLF